jgi:uncharacterized membrane protein YkoI
MATPTERRARAAAVLGAALLVAVALAWGLRDDDRLVDPARPDAQRAIAAARAIVPGELVDVRVDSDNGKWEVTLRRDDGGEHEVELSAGDFELLRIDYD